MENQKTCTSCRWHDVETDQCRRHAPIGDRRWPLVDMDHWCGDWKATNNIRNPILEFIRAQGGQASRYEITRRFQRVPVEIRERQLEELVQDGLLTTGCNPETSRGQWFFVK